jgi:hypothetical protein
MQILRSPNSVRQKSVREEGIVSGFFLMEIVVSSSLSFHVKSSKEDVFEFVLRVPPVKDDEDGSIYKRTEYNKRTDDLQDSS